MARWPGGAVAGWPGGRVAGWRGGRAVIAPSAARTPRRCRGWPRARPPAAGDAGTPPHPRTTPPPLDHRAARNLFRFRAFPFSAPPPRGHSAVWARNAQQSARTGHIAHEGHVFQKVLPHKHGVYILYTISQKNIYKKKVSLMVNSLYHNALMCPMHVGFRGQPVHGISVHNVKPSKYPPPTPILAV